MITDEMLERLLTEAGESYEVPAGGPARILDAATVRSVEAAPRSWWSRPAVLAAAAAVAVVAAVGAASVVRDGGGGQLRQIAISGDDAARQSAATGATDSTGGKATQDYAAPAGAASGGSRAAGGTATGGTGGLASAPAPAAQPQTAPAQDSAKVIKTGAVDLAVDDGQVSPTLTRLEGLATSSGGFVAKSSTNENRDDPSGTVVLRVPAPRFESVVTSVRALGEVRTVNTAGQDVTAQYVDQGARIKALRAQREVYLRLLAEARTIGETLSVQQRIDAVQLQLEQVEGQRRVLEDQTGYGTLTVTVAEEDSDIVTVAKRRSGLSQAWHDAVDGFTSGVEWLVAHSGRALLWLLCLALVAGFARGGYRVLRRRLV